MIDTVWNIILASDAVVEDQSIVCSLLCVSQSMHAAVFGVCAGRVAISFEENPPWPQYPQATPESHSSLLILACENYDLEVKNLWLRLDLRRTFFVSGWVARCSPIIKSLEVDFRHARYPEGQLAALNLADSLQQAAPDASWLQSFCCRKHGEWALMKGLPSSKLTSLELHNTQEVWRDDRSVAKTDMQAMIALNMAKMTNLQALKLASRARNVIAPSNNRYHLSARADSVFMALALPALTQLTKLEFRVDSLVSLQQVLPLSLQQLIIWLDHDAAYIGGFLGAEPPLNLSSLTNLTQLRFANEVEERPMYGHPFVQGRVDARYALRDDDALPPALRELEVRHLTSAKPVIPISSALEELVLQYVVWDDMDSPFYTGFSGNGPQPRNVVLEHAFESALTLCQASLKRLDLLSNGLSIDQLRLIGNLTCLTCLTLRACESAEHRPNPSIKPADLASLVLSPLKGLHQLELLGVMFDVHNPWSKYWPCNWVGPQMERSDMEAEIKARLEREELEPNLQPIATVVATLPHLQHLVFLGAGWVVAEMLGPMHQLTSLTQLTYLDIKATKPFERIVLHSGFD